MTCWLACLLAGSQLRRPDIWRAGGHVVVLAGKLAGLSYAKSEY